jgi:fumarate hydratase class II
MISIQLIQGTFNSKEVVEIITEMIHVKIKYHENKISKSSNEEDMKYRETKIKNLQKELYKLRNDLDSKNGNVTMNALIKIQLT